MFEDHLRTGNNPKTPSRTSGALKLLLKTGEGIGCGGGGWGRVLGGAERRGGEELVGCSPVPHLLVTVADFLRSVVLAVGDPRFFCSAPVVPATYRAVKGPLCLVGAISSGDGARSPLCAAVCMGQVFTFLPL